MPTYKVSAADLPAHFLAQHQRRRDEIVKVVRNTVLTAGPAIAQEELRKSTARKRQPINTGEYARSWQAQPLDNGAVLFNDSPYAIFIERGRRPGAKAPPTDVIMKWLEQKMRGRVKNRKSRMAQAKGLAFVIARAIGRRGLPAHRVMARTRLRLDRMVRDEVAKALDTMRNS